MILHENKYELVYELPANIVKIENEADKELLTSVFINLLTLIFYNIAVIDKKLNITHSKYIILGCYDAYPIVSRYINRMLKSVRMIVIDLIANHEFSQLIQQPHRLKKIHCERDGNNIAVTVWV